MHTEAKFRLLVVRLGSMGDILHALPAVTALRVRHPDWEIGWVLEPRWRALLSAATGRDQRTEAREQRSEIRDQGTENGDRGAVGLGPRKVIREIRGTVCRIPKGTALR